MKLKITKQEKQGLKNTFKNFGKQKTEENIFYDLCFCILAPQTTFKANKKVMDELIALDFYNSQRIFNIALKQGFINKRKKIYELEVVLKPTRFYRNKTKYLLEAKEKFRIIGKMAIQWNRCNKGFDMYKVRNYLVKNVKGLGMKAASHFLRNLGDQELAIIDTHIIKFLQKYYISIVIFRNYKPYISFSVRRLLNGNNKISISYRIYLELESIFQKIAKKNKLTTAELDALIWQRYSNTKWEDFKY